MAFLVTVFFSPSLRTKLSSCTRHVDVGITVHSFLTRLQQDFNLQRSVSELELFSLPASRLWLGTVGTTALCDKCHRLSANERVFLQLGQGLDKVLFLVEKMTNRVSSPVKYEEELRNEGRIRDNTSIYEKAHVNTAPKHSLESLTNKTCDVVRGEVLWVSESDSESTAGSLEVLPGLWNMKRPHSLSTHITDTQQILPCINTESTPLEITNTEATPLEITNTESTPLEITNIKPTQSKLTNVDSTQLEIADTKPTPFEIKDAESTHSEHRIITKPDLLCSQQSTSPESIVTRTNVLEPPQMSSCGSGKEVSIKDEVIILSSTEEDELVTNDVDKISNKPERIHRDNERVVQTKMTIEYYDSGLNTTVESIPMTEASPRNAISTTNDVCVIEDDDGRIIGRDGVPLMCGWMMKREGEGEGSDEGIGMEVGVGSDSGDNGGSVIVIGSDCDDDINHVVDYNQTRMEPGRVIQCCGMELSQSDFNTLLPNQCLNDQVINCYMKLLVKQAVKKPNSVAIASTFFYTKLCHSGVRGVKRWMKMFDFHKLSLLLVPVHLPSQHHWCLAAIHIKRKFIEYYDSLGGRNPHCMKKLLQFVMRRLKKHSKSQTGVWCHDFTTCLRAKQHWRKCYPKGLPKQSGGTDCGVFVCQFARWLCSSPECPHSSIPFTHSHIYRIRYIMKHELETGKLDRLNF